MNDKIHLRIYNKKGQLVRVACTNVGSVGYGRTDNPSEVTCVRCLNSALFDKVKAEREKAVARG